MNLALVGNSTLRAAMRRNLVSFPAQIPAFVKHGDMQERIVQLYFIRGWQIKAICCRYGLSKSTVRKLLSEWRIRAIGAGYIQDIHPEVLATLAKEDDAVEREAFELSAPQPDFTDFGARAGNHRLHRTRILPSVA